MAEPPRLDTQGLWRRGAEALRRGDAISAMRDFQAIVAAGGADATVWTGMAMAARAAGDGGAHIAALDQILKLEPRNMRALMMKGDHYSTAGDARAASSFYSAVVKIADRSGALPPDLTVDVARARAAVEDHALRYEQHLQSYLERRGLGAPGTERVVESLDLLLGRKAIFQQQPRLLYFPGLPQIQFYERTVFPWMAGIEAAWQDIRQELLDVLQDEDVFTPYIQGDSDRPVFDEIGLLNDPSWSVFYLWKGGAPVAENVARCPKTAAAMLQAPLCQIPGRTPSVHFSLLRPGTHIASHTGFMNARLICHLPLIVPDGCAMRVGNDTREWVEGQGCVFDDTIEHEAWNKSDKLRVVLIFDIWRPELTEVERALVSATLQAIDNFGGEAADFDA